MAKMAAVSSWCAAALTHTYHSHCLPLPPTTTLCHTITQLYVWSSRPESQVRHHQAAQAEATATTHHCSGGGSGSNGSSSGGGSSNNGSMGAERELRGRELRGSWEGAERELRGRELRGRELRGSLEGAERELMREGAGREGAEREGA
jgi:hypothetical protein